MPFFLWLLPLTAIPLLIHLLSRRNIITIDFSTLRFLKMMEKESIRKLKLRQLILLILRTIIILLFIIMITRPMLPGAFSLQNSGESALHAIILDDSFSMQGNYDIIEKAAISILQQIPEKGQLVWLNLNKGVQYKGLKEDMPPLVNFLSYTYHTGNIADGLNYLNQHIENDYIFKEVYLLTDSQHEPLKDLWEHSDKYDNMHLYAIIAPQHNDNLAITNVELISEILRPNHTIDLEVSVKNTGKAYQKDIPLHLIINNMNVGQQLISLPKETKKTYLFKTALPKTGIHQAMVELDNDDKKADNRYFFNLFLPDHRNIALISNSQEDSYYIQTSLKALNKSGESLTLSEYLSMDDPGLKLGNQDAVFIISPSILPTARDSKIEEYLYNGGHLIILPGINSNPADLSIIKTLAPDIEGNYRNLTINELSDDAFQDIDLSSIKIGEINKLFLSATGQDRNIRLFKYVKLPYDPEYSQLLLSDGSAVWNRYIIHSGIIDVFGFSMNLNWSNFPIKGTFLPFIHFIAYSQTNRKEKLSESVENYWEVIPDDYISSKIFHILPDGSQKIINSNEKNHLITEKLEHPGHHNMQTDGIIIREIAVNIDETELNCNYASIELLQDKAPENMQIISMESDVMTEIKQARIGIEIWRYILFLGIFLVMIEMLISNVKR